MEFHGIAWNLECANFYDERFHGIPCNLWWANFDDTSSSMEFRGTCGAPISLTRAVLWNSMEIGVRQFRWHEQFHWIPWKLECANFDGTSSSLKFRGTCAAPFSLTREVLWNSMEFHGNWGAPISMTRAVPLNSMEIGVRQFRRHEQFHGIPWDLWCANFADTSSSMEFHGILWNLECANFDDTSSSMEFHGTSLGIKYIKIEVALIPRNCDKTIQEITNTNTRYVNFIIDHDYKALQQL